MSSRTFDGKRPARDPAAGAGPAGLRRSGSGGAAAPPAAAAAAVDLDGRLERARRLGHSFERLPVSGSGRAGAGGGQASGRQVVQAKINWQAHDNENDETTALVKVYNEHVGKKIFFGEEARKQALVHLHGLERSTHAWFDRNRAPDLDASPQARNMKSLLNELQKERIDLVDRSLKKGDRTPPIASFDALGHDERQRVTGIWDRLRGGDGIHIAEQGDEPEVQERQKGFRTRVLADFSRILETSAGRDLVGGIQSSGGGLTIKPTTLARGKFAASPVNAEHEGLSPVPEPAEEERANFAALGDVSALPRDERISLLHGAKTRNQDKRGFSLTAGEESHYFEFGAGTGSNLRVPVDAQDAMPHPSSRGVDAEGNEILAPTFVNLTHELGHVLRSRQGVSVGAEAGQQLLASAFPGEEVGEWNRPEEFFNIPGVENQVRAQSKISARHGHNTLMGHQGTQHMNQIEGVLGRLQGLEQGGGLAEHHGKRAAELKERAYSLQAGVNAFLKHGGDSVGLTRDVAALSHDEGELRQAASQQNL